MLVRNLEIVSLRAGNENGVARRQVHRTCITFFAREHARAYRPSNRNWALALPRVHAPEFCISSEQSIRVGDQEIPVAS